MTGALLLAPAAGIISAKNYGAMGLLSGSRPYFNRRQQRGIGLATAKRFAAKAPSSVHDWSSPRRVEPQLRGPFHNSREV